MADGVAMRKEWGLARRRAVRAFERFFFTHCYPTLQKRNVAYLEMNACLVAEPLQTTS